MAQERLILAVPAGPEELESPRHSTGSRLSVPTHNFLRRGCELDYSLAGKYHTYVEGQPIEIAEFKGSDIPAIVAEGGRIQVGIVGVDHVLNLPEGQLRQVEILRTLGYGVCEFRLGVPMGRKYPGEDGEDSMLGDVAGLRVATALPVLAQRKFNERGVRVTIIPMDGHVENAIRYGRADVIVDITESGGTMRRNGIMPAESLEALEAVLIVNKFQLSDLGRQRMLNRLLSRVDKALRNPRVWRDPDENNHMPIISNPFTNIPPEIISEQSLPQVAAS